MKRWSLALCLVFLTTSVGRAQQDAPAVVVWTHSLDSFVNQTKTLLDQIGRSKAGDDFGGIVKSKLGPKGFVGIDGSRPLGAIVRFDPDPSAAVIVPIVGQKEFFELLDRMDYKTKKEEDGTYSIQALPHVPVYAKIVGQHVWIAFVSKSAFAAKVDPAKDFPQQGRLLSARLRFDALPKDLRQLVVSGFEDAIQSGAKKNANNPPGVKALNDSIQRYLAAFVAQVLQEGQELSLDVGFDAAAKNLGVNVALTPKPNTPLAKSLAEAGNRASIFAVDAEQELPGMTAKINLALPDAIAKAAARFVEDAMLDGAATLGDDRKKQAADLVAVVKPTFEAGEIDVVYRVVGPGGADKKVGLVFGFKTKEGDRLGAIFKTLAAEAKKSMSAAEQAKLMLDADVAGATTIHRVVLPADKVKNQDVLGDSTLSLGFRPDATFVAMGWESLPALKRIATGVKPGPAKMAQVTIDVLQLAPLLTDLAKVRAQAPAIFTQKSDGFCQLDVTGGDRLGVNLTIRTPVLKFLEAARDERVDEKK